jgi:amidase
MNDLVFASAVTLADAIAGRRVSAVEVLEAHLAQIGRHNTALNAVITIDETAARQRAREADVALARGETWGPLHGVPVTLKDVHHTAGMRSTIGHPDFVDHIPSTDSAIPARLKRAGAILLGKTNVALFPDNPFGVTNNPWNLEHTPGGSSSGAAAAVAAGLSPLDIGSDAMGSVLYPCHACGVFGMRPTERRVSLSGMMWSEPAFLWHVVMVFGPIARSARDLDLAMRVIAGPEGHDSNVPPMPWRESPPVRPTDLRIAWSPSLGAPVASEIQQTVARLANELERLGVHMEERLPDVDLADQVDVAEQIWSQLIGAFTPSGEASPTVSLGDHLMTLDRRSRFIAAWEEFFTEWDVLICPVYVTTAPRHDEPDPPQSIDGQAVTQAACSAPALLSPSTGHPTIVVPAGRDSHGLPIGVQVIGRRWDDERLIRIAELAAEVSGSYERPPRY